jgi:hypothetical protein
MCRLPLVQLIEIPDRACKGLIHQQWQNACHCERSEAESKHLRLSFESFQPPKMLISELAVIRSE